MKKNATNRIVSGPMVSSASKRDSNHHVRLSALRARIRLFMICITSLLILNACRDTKATSRFAGPTFSTRALSHQDSLRQGYFQPRAQASLSASSCDIDCPQYLGAEPSAYQGYAQPGPVTMNFSGAIGKVRVSGTGAIQCSSGQYGTLIGYDSTGAEIGRVDLHLIAPEDCSPPDAPDDVTFGAEATLYTSRPIARVVITPMSPLQFEVYGECCGYAQATYGVVFEKGNLGAINLTCSDTVNRGATTSCTAAPLDPTQTLTVTGWSYTSVDGDRRDRQLNISSPTWQGQLAVDGDVVVSGVVGGVRGQSTPQRVAVRARNWVGKVAKKDHEIVFPSTMVVRPTAFDGQLGTTALELPLDLTAQSQWSVTIDDDGPNQGFLYLVDVPVKSWTRPQVNTNALNGTSDFYRIQESRQRKIGGITYCAQSFVTGIIPMIQTHEGYDPVNQPNSHAGIFRRHVDSLAYKVFEAAAGSSDGPAVTSRVTSLFNEASNDSAAMDHDSRNNITTQTLTCQFWYDYSRLNK